MGIKAKFTQSDLDNMFRIRMGQIEAAVISRLKFIGETFVNNARTKGEYMDQTGNLRSSIGYIVLKDGQKKAENFQLAGRGSDKALGLNTGKKYINELRARFGKGYVLIVVAGMDYAAAVESMGKDVLTASSVIAKAQLRKAVSDFKKTLKQI